MLNIISYHYEDKEPATFGLVHNSIVMVTHIVKSGLYSKQKLDQYKMIFFCLPTFVIQCDIQNPLPYKNYREN